MTKVIQITDRLESEKKKKQAELYTEKIRAIQRTVRCGACRLKCAMCGRYLREEELHDPVTFQGMETSLCPCCKAEFEDFKRVSKNPDQSCLFWQKRPWLRVWETWVLFQKALNDFKQSQEFKSLTTLLDE